MRAQRGVNILEIIWMQFKIYADLQSDYECVYCIVDVHASTTVETTQDLKQNTVEMALDWLAAGIRTLRIRFCSCNHMFLK